MLFLETRFKIKRSGYFQIVLNASLFSWTLDCWLSKSLIFTQGQTVRMSGPSKLGQHLSQCNGSSS